MAGPSDMHPLNLYREFEFIDDRIYGARYRDEFIVYPRFSASYHRLHKYLMRFNPDIVHFSGHGSSQGQLVFINDEGTSQIADEEMIESIFGILNGKVRLVFLNACYSAIQATAIGKHVPVVIGMTEKIEDRIAIEFAASFYEGIANGLLLLRNGTIVFFELSSLLMFLQTPLT